MDGHGHLNITPHDRSQIAEHVALGFNAGAIDRDGVRITWVLTTDVFSN